MPEQVFPTQAETRNNMSNASPAPGSFAEPIQPWWLPVWERHKARYSVATSVTGAGETALRRELMFCLLGGHGVTYELASSATTVLMTRRPFHPSWTPEGLRCAVQLELETPQFAPLRSDGRPRRYRYPARKAGLIAAAVGWVNERGGLRAGLAARRTDSERREWLCACPGVALKTASWLLRNCGWAQELAILDVHLLRALTEVGLVEDGRLPRDYLRIERAYLDWATRLGASPAALDLFLWDMQRARHNLLDARIAT